MTTEMPEENESDLNSTVILLILAQGAGVGFTNELFKFHCDSINMAATMEMLQIL